MRGLTPNRQEREIAGAPNRLAAAAVPSRLTDWLRLALIGLGISVVPLDTSVNIAFPDITRSFDLPIPMIQWVVICYVLTHAGLMLAFGRIGDMWSHAGVFRVGLLWSVFAFLLCAAAPSFGWLLFFRFLQGIGAGLIISCAPALVTSLYAEARRSHALGIFTLMFALGSALGPLIGGVLVARWGWPGVFWFRAPIALTALLLLRGLPGAGARAGRGSFDILGALLLACGLTGFLLTVNALPRLGGEDHLALALIAATAASLAGFVRWERRAARPIVQVELFRRPGFAAIMIANVVMYLSTFSVMLFAPYYLVRFTLLPLPLAGAVLAAGFAAMALASPPAGWLVARLSAGRIAPLGAVVAGGGLFLVGLWQPGTSVVVMVLALSVQGLGMGFFHVASMEIVMASLPITQRGVAGSLSMLTRTIGTVTGAAALTIGFSLVEFGAIAAGAGSGEAFLSAFSAIFRVAGVAAAAVAILVAWSARGRS